MILLLAACGHSSQPKPDGSAAADAATGPADIDTSFGTAGTVLLPSTQTCRAFAVDASDRPLVLSSDANGQTLTRFDTKGSVDTTFAPSALGAAGIAAAGLFVLPSGKVVVSGVFGANFDDPHIFRLTNNTIDLDLRLPSPIAGVIGVAERSDGGLDIVGPGNAFGTPFLFTRITAGGAVDTTFGNQGVAAPTTSNPSLPPDYFPHAVSLGNGTFALSAATFKQVNPQGGTGPVVGHLVLAADGAITQTTTIDNTQFLSLAGHAGQLYALTNAFPSNVGAVARFGADLTADASFTAAESSTFAPVFGFYNGGALAVAPDGSLIATNGTTLDRFHADGTVRAKDAYAFTYCGVAFDSHARPLVASSTAVLRLVP
jgi:hypothetical protein